MMPSDDPSNDIATTDADERSTKRRQAELHRNIAAAHIALADELARDANATPKSAKDVEQMKRPVRARGGPQVRVRPGATAAEIERARAEKVMRRYGLA